MSNARSLVFDALDNAYAGGYASFVFNNPTAVVAADLSNLIDDLLECPIEDIEAAVEEWKADKVPQQIVKHPAPEVKRTRT